MINYITTDSSQNKGNILLHGGKVMELIRTLDKQGKSSSAECGSSEKYQDNAIKIIEESRRKQNQSRHKIRERESTGLID